MAELLPVKASDAVRPCVVSQCWSALHAQAPAPFSLWCWESRAKLSSTTALHGQPRRAGDCPQGHSTTQLCAQPFTTTIFFFKF